MTVVRRRPDRLHGIVIVDKPTGVSSQDVVTRVRKRLGVRSAGHTGTLDPLATGVLPICLGQATKIAQWLIAEDKRYVATCELGLTSPTLDSESEVTRTAVVDAIEPAALEAALATLRGAQDQVPPMHSAIWIDGRRLHELARAGVEVTPPARSVRVDELTVVEIAPPTVTLRIACSKGTYVRALVRDLGERLGTGAVLTALRRTASGAFTEAQAVPMEALDRHSIAAHLVPIRLALGLPEVVVDDAAIADVINGHEQRCARYADGFANGDRFQLVSARGETLAVCERVAGRTLLGRVLVYEPTLGLDAVADVPQSAPLNPQGREPGPD
ncbi:MAG: tRNA pseudouridine(55) synthase TruB [Myxococcales bacterium]|nr:tRNA pseudouridine(55) synthase TruB [Myxococcales bacterium]